MDSLLISGTRDTNSIVVLVEPFLGFTAQIEVLKKLQIGFFRGPFISSTLNGVACVVFAQLVKWEFDLGHTRRGGERRGRSGGGAPTFLGPKLENKYLLIISKYLYNINVVFRPLLY